MKYINMVVDGVKIEGKWNEKSYKSNIEEKVKIFINNQAFDISERVLEYFKNNEFKRDFVKCEKKVGLNKVKPVSLTEILINIK